MRRGYHSSIQETPLHALQRAVEQVGDKVFVDIAGEELTYHELDRRSTRLAHSLAGPGVKAGDTVVTMLESSLDVFVCWFAVNKLGAIWCRSTSPTATRSCVTRSRTPGPR